MVAPPAGSTQFAAPFQVGDWTVIPGRNVVVRGQEIRVEPRLMDLLVVLAERAGEPVSRDELTERVWKRQYVTDDVIAAAVSGLRRILGDDARTPSYIETVSRRGYRLIATVRTEAPLPAAASGALASAELPRRRSIRLQPFIVAAAAVFVLVAATSTVFAARSRRHVPNAESHEAYLKGRFFLDQRSIRAWQQALDNFRRAIALDPDNAAAHAGLADTYSTMADFGVATAAEMRPQAFESAQRALAVDASSAEGFAALGRAHFLFDWDFAWAERNLTRGIALDRDHMPAYQAMAWLRSAQGRHDEAIAAARRALQLDPVNTARYTELAWVLALGGRHADALREIERATQLNPRAWEAYVAKGWVLESANQPDSAFAAYQHAWRVSGTSAERLRSNEAAYNKEGLRGYYRRWLLSPGDGALSQTARAQVLARLGERDSALVALERAYEKGEGALAWIDVEPSYSSLRADPRFQRLAAAIPRMH